MSGESGSLTRQSYPELDRLRSAARRLTDAVLQVEVNDGRSAWNELLAARAALIVAEREIGTVLDG